MLSNTKKSIAAAATLPAIPKELIDQFVTGPMSAEAVNAASVASKKALIERALGGELSHHLGYPPGAVRPEDAANHRNGKSGKTVLTDDDRCASVSPANGKTLASYEKMSERDVKDAIDKAHAAYLSWRNTSFDERAALTRS